MTLHRWLQTATALGIAAACGLVMCALALQDIAHGEADVRSEWWAVRISLALMALFIAVAFMTLARVRRAERHGLLVPKANTLLAILLLSAGAVATASATQQPPAQFLLEAGRAGRLEVGTPVDEVYQIFGRDNVSLVAEFREGSFVPVLKIKMTGAAVTPAISADIREWPCAFFSISSLDVRDSRFRTKEGFGVGSTAGELHRAHPFRIFEDEGSHAAFVNELNMSFSLTRQGPVDQQKVTSVGIGSDPDVIRRKRCPDR